MRYLTAWDAIKWAASMSRHSPIPTGQGGPVVGVSYAYLLMSIGFAVGALAGFGIAAFT